MSDPKRVYNLNPGPAALPLEVLQQAQAEMLDYKGSGMSVMEISHRSKEFEGILQTADADLRELLGIPSNYKILFLQGGASLQFTMLPMNLRATGSADYILTGTWSKTAFKEAEKLGATRAAASTESEGFAALPSKLDLDPKAAYLHFTSNETIHGVEYFKEPQPPADVPLICDASSDFISRPVDVSKYALIYAGAQKNVGPAGLTIVIVREDLLGRAQKGTPTVMDYKQQADAGSMLNTPATYAIYVAGLVFKWIKRAGGLAGIEQRNLAKANLLYDFLDHSGFFRNPVAKSDRSRMNVQVTLADPKLDAEFLKGAEERGMVQLKGHRSVGGMRASIYNAMRLEGVQHLVAYMKEFEARHG